MLNIPVKSKRLCMRCRNWKPRERGVEVKSKDGLRYKWVCKDCFGLDERDV